MDDWEKAVSQMITKEQELEQTIKAMVKELYRLQGKVCYETLEDHAIAEGMRDYWKHLGNAN